MFNFPNSPIQGQLYTPVGGYQYVYLDGVWRVVEAPQSVGTAQTRNRIVNGAMQVSQENGDTQSSWTGVSYFCADQWFGTTVIATVTGGRLPVASALTSNGGRVVTSNIATGKPSLAAGDYWQFIQHIEGIRVADFQWGTASAKQAVLRFSAYSSLVPGTYTVKVSNTVDRTFLAPFTLTAGVWKDVVIAIPGDTTGTWLKDNSKALQVSFTFAAGTSFATGAAGWQAGTIPAIAGSTNGAATSGNQFLIADVGLYLDPLATGIAPPWVMPDEAEELRACMRYWERTGQYVGLSTTYVTTGVSFTAVQRWLVTKRSNPAVSGTYTGGSGFPAAIGNLGSDGTTGFYEQKTSNATLANGYWQSTVTGNARM